MWRYYDFSSELYHHGVKGMKWGVRRTPEQLGRSVSKKKNAVGAYAGKVGRGAKNAAYSVGRGAKAAGSAAGRGAKTLGTKAHKSHAEKVIRSGDAKKITKNRKHLDDQEFSRAVKRANDQQRLDSLQNSSNQGVVEKGSKFTGDILKSAAKTTLTAAAAGAMSYAGYKYMRKKHPEMAPVLFPKAERFFNKKRQSSPKYGLGNKTPGGRYVALSPHQQKITRGLPKGGFTRLRG